MNKIAVDQSFELDPIEDLIGPLSDLTDKEILDFIVELAFNCQIDFVIKLQKRLEKEIQAYNDLVGL
jgi:hypothetical protein